MSLGLSAGMIAKNPSLAYQSGAGRLIFMRTECYFIPLRSCLSAPQVGAKLLLRLRLHVPALGDAADWSSLLASHSFGGVHRRPIGKHERLTASTPDGGAPVPRLGAPVRAAWDVA